MQRRAYMALGGAVIATLAGCASDDGGNGETTQTETTTPGESPTETDEPSGEGPTLGNAIAPETSFAFTGRYQIPEGEDDGTMEGRFHDGDSYVVVTVDGESFEQYVVDDVGYLVYDGQCFENPPSGVEPADPGQDPNEWDEDVEQYRDLAPDGTTTVDGEQAYYYVIEDGGEQIIYYVSVSSGRLLRVEFPSGRIDYHSWGSVDPVTTPDMECTAF